jgi:hypothetical protein
VTKYTDDREGRSRLIFDMLASTGPHDSTPSDWVRAVEWYENRPSVGYSPGECLVWCLVRCQAITFVEWALLEPETQRAYTAAANTLRAHGTSR